MENCVAWYRTAETFDICSIMKLQDRKREHILIWWVFQTVYEPVWLCLWRSTVCIFLFRLFRPVIWHLYEWIFKLWFFKHSVSLIAFGKIKVLKISYKFSAWHWSVRSVILGLILNWARANEWNTQIDR